MNKVFIDSNIIIRLIVKDPLDQFLKAKETIRHLEENKLQGILSLLVVNEIIWILEHYYDLKRSEFIPSLFKLIVIRNITIYEIKKDIILNILVKMQKKKFDFTDLYLSEIAKDRKIISFDKDFEKLGN